jgi:hypothetical protein
MCTTHTAPIYPPPSRCTQVPETSSRNSDGLFMKSIHQKQKDADARVLARRTELAALTQQGAGVPSFYERDMAALKEKKERLKRHRNDKSRFQVGIQFPSVCMATFCSRCPGSLLGEMLVPGECVKGCNHLPQLVVSLILLLLGWCLDRFPPTSLSALICCTGLNGRAAHSGYQFVGSCPNKQPCNSSFCWGALDKCTAVHDRGCTCVQVKFKAKEVPRSVYQQRFMLLQAAAAERAATARMEAQAKLEKVNREFGEKQGRVADAMAAASSPFVGTVEDNIMCALPQPCVCPPVLENMPPLSLQHVFVQVRPVVPVAYGLQMSAQPARRA